MFCLHAGNSILAVSHFCKCHWVALSSQRAVVLDLSAFGEPVFAALVPAVMASSDLAEIAAQHKIEPWDLYIDANSAPERAPASESALVLF